MLHDTNSNSTFRCSDVQCASFLSAQPPTDHSYYFVHRLPISYAYIIYLYKWDLTQHTVYKLLLPLKIYILNIFPSQKLHTSFFKTDAQLANGYIYYTLFNQIKKNFKTLKKTVVKKSTGDILCTYILMYLSDYSSEDIF